MAPTPIYEFVTFRVDERQHQLFNEGTPVPLPPKVFDTLLALVRRQGEVVGRQELLELIWPGTFVEEAGLTRNISVLRKALAGNDSDQQFIETVPKRGYRFVMPIRLVEREAAPAADEPQPSRAVRSSAAVLALVGLVLGSSWLFFDRARVPAEKPASASAGVPALRRLVVLPFENLTKNASDDWLAGGFSDSLTYGLRNVETLALVNRERIAEVYREQGFKDAAALEPKVVQELSRRLGVQYYVHGSYQRVANDVRVVARLVEADTGQIRGQESVTDRFDNILQIEDRLASRFAAALAPELPEDTRASGTRSLPAYRSFTEGVALYTSGDYDEAEKRLADAVARDPRYAEAWALSSKILSRIGRDSATTKPRSAAAPQDAVTAAARRAIEINPSLYDAHVALALAHRAAGRLGEWREEARTAMELNPRAAEAYEVLADSYSASPSWGCGRDRDPPLAEQYYKTALRLDPLLAVGYLNLAGNMIWANRLEGALAVVDQGLLASPRHQSLLSRRLLLLAALNRPTDRAARAALQPTTLAGLFADALADLQLGQAAEAWRALDRADQLMDAMSPEYDIYAASAYLTLGRPKRAVTRLEHAVGVEPQCARYIANWSLLNRFKNVPEFADFLARHPG